MHRPASHYRSRAGARDLNSIVHFIASLIHALLRAAANSLVALVTTLGIALAIVAAVVALGCGVCGVGGIGILARRRRKDS